MTYPGIRQLAVEQKIIYPPPGYVLYVHSFLQRQEQRRADTPPAFGPVFLCPAQSLPRFTSGPSVAEFMSRRHLLSAQTLIAPLKGRPAEIRLLPARKIRNPGPGPPDLTLGPLWACYKEPNCKSIRANSQPEGGTCWPALAGA
jgi:hypothetical protein